MGDARGDTIVPVTPVIRQGGESDIFGVDVERMRWAVESEIFGSVAWRMHVDAGLQVALEEDGEVRVAQSSRS